MWTALGTTRIATSSEINASAIIVSVAQGLMTETPDRVRPVRGRVEHGMALPRYRGARRLAAGCALGRRQLACFSVELVPARG